MSTVAPPDLWRSRGAIAAITIGAMALRAALLGDGLTGLPPGLHVDEAHNGMDALRILAGARPLYLAGNDGREALYSYVQAATVGAFGPRVWSLRLASVLLGTATIPLAWQLARRLPVRNRHAVALASAALLAGLLWHVHFSRLAIRGVALPLVAGVAGVAVWRAIGTGRNRTWLTAGAAFGLALYVHPAGRLLPAVPALWLGGWAIAERLRGQRAAAARRLTGLLWLEGAALVTALPLLLWGAAHAEAFLGHAAAVSVLDPGVGAGQPLARAATNAWRLARATVWRGSDSWYHNVAGRPIFDPLVGLAFLGGSAWLIVALAGRTRGARERAAAGFLTSWLVVMALPTVLTGGAPNASRAIGLLPALVVPAAVGLVAAGRWLSRATRSPYALPALIAVVALLSAAQTARDTFGRYAASPEPARAMGVAAVEKGVALRALAEDGGGAVYPSRLVEERSVLRYLTHGAPLTPLDLAAGLVVPKDGRGRYAFAADEEADAAAAFAERWPTADRDVLAGPSGAPRWLLFGAPALPEPAPDGPVFGGAIALDAVWGPMGPGQAIEAEPGQVLPLTIVWRSVGPLEDDWTAFLHLVADGERGIGQDDRPPLAGYPTSRWQPGDRVVARFAPTVDPAAHAGPFRVRVGWYRLLDGERLPLPGDDDAAADVAMGTIRR